MFTTTMKAIRAWIKAKRLRTVDLNLGYEIDFISSFRIVFVPALTASLLAAAITAFWINSSTPAQAVPASMQQQVAKPRQLLVNGFTADFRPVVVTVSGRQIRNSEQKIGSCELFWSASVQSIVGSAGTVTVDDQTYIDSYVTQGEIDIFEQAEFDLRGVSLVSDNCEYDIHTALVIERRS